MIVLIVILFVFSSPWLSFGIDLPIFEYTLPAIIDMPVLMNARQFDNIFVKIVKLIKVDCGNFA
jgi:hypothetical protein